MNAILLPVVSSLKPQAFPMLHRRFLILLILLGLLVVVHPVAMQGGPAHMLLRVLITGVFAVAIWNVFSTRRTRTIALVLGVPAMLAHWANARSPPSHIPGFRRPST